MHPCTLSSGGAALASAWSDLMQMLQGLLLSQLSISGWELEL